MTKNEVEFRQLLTEIKRKDFSPVYILMGEEAYYIDMIASALEENVVDEADRDFNLTSYYGSEIDIPTIIATAQQFPVMANKRLVMVKEAQSKQNAKNELEGLADYIKQPNATTVLVIIFKGDNLNATSKLMKAAVSSTVKILKSPRLRDYQLAEPIKDYVSKKRLDIEDKAVQMLCDYIGSDLSKLFGEIDKLIVATGSGFKGITADLVEKNIGISKEFNNFELQSALIHKNYDKAMSIIDYFGSNPSKNPSVVMTGTLFSFFSKLVIAHFAVDKSESGISSLLSLKSGPQQREFFQAMRNYSASQAIGAIHALRDFDTRSKGIESFQNEFELLKELIYRIFILR